MTVLSLLIAAIQILQLLIVARIILSYFPAASYSPAGRVLSAIVDPILRPFRAILPTFAGIDFSPMLAILVLLGISRVLENLQFGTLSIGGSITFVVVQLILDIIVFFCIVIFIRVLLAFFHASPFHPVVLFIRQATNPLVRPFAAVAPRSRELDIPAVIALIVYIAIYLVARVLLTRLL